MKNVTKIDSLKKCLFNFFLSLFISLFFVSCSSYAITFGEIGLRLPFNEDDSKLVYEVSISGVNVDFSKNFYGFSGDTFVIDNLDSGKYEISYKAKKYDDADYTLYGSKKVSVYVGIISPVSVDLENIETDENISLLNEEVL